MCMLLTTIDCRKRVLKICFDVHEGVVYRLIVNQRLGSTFLLPRTTNIDSFSSCFIPRYTGIINTVDYGTMFKSPSKALSTIVMQKGV